MRAAIFVPLFVLAFSSCPQVNPDVGRFSCDPSAAADCGPGYECRPQFGGGGRCYREGQCTELEHCDGADENCDGRIDETFPEEGDACSTGLRGACAAGARACRAGNVECAQTVMPTQESCNSIDDDCDGETDETFDFNADEANCGGCGRACAAGTSCFSAVCEETLCDDGADNDQDGVIDCNDTSCLGQVCVSPMQPPWRCGAVLRSDAGVDAGVDPDGGADAGLESDAGMDAGLEWDGGFFPGCYAPESACDNGLDDDGDGEADCLDVDCAGRVCASGTICTNRSCPGPG